MNQRLADGAAAQKPQGIAHGVAHRVGLERRLAVAEDVERLEGGVDVTARLE